MRPGHSGRRGGGSLNLYIARERGYPATETVEEYLVRDDLARQVGGLTEVGLPLGFADVMNSQAVFEVEPRRSWRHGARQVLAYSAQCGLPPALDLFRAIPAAEMLDIFTELRALELRGLRDRFIDLWWWTGQGWRQITSPALCADMPHGAVFGTCEHCGHRVAWLGESVVCYDYGPRHGVSEMHCCAKLCPLAHQNMEWCLYWAAWRAT